MNTSVDIVCMGEPLIEFNQREAGVPQFQMGHGGDTSNAAIAAARSGARVGYLTAVGDDAFGASLRDLWAREGVDQASVVTDPAAPTGIYFVTHGPEGHAFSYLRAGSAASRFGLTDKARDLIRNARVLHLSGISHAISSTACDAAFDAMAVAKAAGVTVSYDTNLRLRLWPLARATAVIEAATRQSDIVLPGLDDARQLTGLATPDAIADHYLAGGARIVALTLGKEGALVATPADRRLIPSISVNAVDATGAGDCFDGAFLAEWLRTGDAFKAGAYAVVAAALSTLGYGAVAPLPTRAIVEAHMAESARKAPVR